MVCLQTSRDQQEEGVGPEVPSQGARNRAGIEGQARDEAHCLAQDCNSPAPPVAAQNSQRRHKAPPGAALDRCHSMEGTPSSESMSLKFARKMVFKIVDSAILQDRNDLKTWRDHVKSTDLCGSR